MDVDEVSLGFGALEAVCLFVFSPAALKWHLNTWLLHVLVVQHGVGMTHELGQVHLHSLHGSQDTSTHGVKCTANSAVPVGRKPH